MIHNPGADWQPGRGGQPNVCAMFTSIHSFLPLFAIFASDLTQCMSDLADIPLALFALNIQRWLQQLYSSTYKILIYVYM